VRPLWVAGSPPGLHTDGMTATTPVTTFVAGAAGIISSTLLLALPLVATQARDAQAMRTIEVRLSRYAFSPARIEIGLGETVRLDVVSMDGPHGFQVEELGLNVRLSTRGKAETLEVTPHHAGTFPVTCSVYCGNGHDRMKAWLIVTPGR
jgi:cytochrome c oxidase subunit 2